MFQKKKPVTSAPVKKIPAGVAPVTTSGTYDPDMDGDNDALGHDESKEPGGSGRKLPASSGKKISNIPALPGAPGKAKNKLAGANPQGPITAPKETALPGDANPGAIDTEDATVGRIKKYNKGKPAGRQVKDPFKLASAVKRLKAARG